MLFIRRAASAFGPRARTFLPTSNTSAAAPRYFSVTAWLKEADSNSSASAKPLPETIWPPWQISDLGAWEMELYEKHGPNYIDHVPPKKQDLIRRRTASRMKIEAQLKEQLGDKSDAWYEVLCEASRRNRQLSDSTVAEFKQRKKELGPAHRGSETPEQLRLAKDMEDWFLWKQRENYEKIRREVAEERLRQS